MHTSRLLKLALAGAVLATLPTTAQAHRQWMTPSSTVVSGEDNWITVDAAASNDLFYIDHRPLQAKPVVTAPDGSTVEVANHAVGQMRATFDVHLQQQGTYRVAIVNLGVIGNYKLAGETKNLPRGTTRANLAERVPAGATDLVTADNMSRNEIFLTQGAPSTQVFTPANAGIELVPVTHPNDLYAGETATFQFLKDGKPTEGLTVTAIPGGIRYRDELNQMDLKTDGEGKVAITWPEPGLYWINVTEGGDDEEGAGPGGPPRARVSYVTVVEVLAS
jgi:uncharacterized GH25 family protein